MASRATVGRRVKIRACLITARGDGMEGWVYRRVRGGAKQPRGVPVGRYHWLDTHSGQAALNSIEG